MKTKNPMRGLLTFSFYAASGNASLVLLVGLVLAVAFLVIGHAFFLNMLALAALVIFPMMVMASMGDKSGKWERFQLTLPIRRRNLLAVQYITVLLTAILGVILVVATIGVGYVLGESVLLDDGVDALIMGIVPILGMPFFMAGMFFLLASSKIGRGREAGLVSVCQFAAIGIILLAPWAGDRFGISFQTLAIGILAVSALVFIVSYFITRVLYAKMDF